MYIGVQRSQSSDTNLSSRKLNFAQENNFPSIVNWLLVLKLWQLLNSEYIFALYKAYLQHLQTLCLVRNLRIPILGHVPKYTIV